MLVIYQIKYLHIILRPKEYYKYIQRMVFRTLLLTTIFIDFIKVLRGILLSKQNASIEYYPFPILLKYFYTIVILKWMANLWKTVIYQSIFKHHTSYWKQINTKNFIFSFMIKILLI